jgi:hypothetical protein
MTASKDIAAVAGQLADLTRTVEEMGSQLAEMRERAASQQGAPTSNKSALTSPPRN